MNISIAIPVRLPEPRLVHTLESIRATAPEAEIILIYDGNKPGKIIPGVKTVFQDRRGTQFSRHVGIMVAKHDNVFTCDAHMDFAPGWAEKVTEYLNLHPRGLCCLKMAGMEPECKGLRDARAMYKGAAINWMTREPLNNFCGTLMGKWSNNVTGENGLAEISCVMGACYGIRKSWYLQMGKPWQFGTGWGSDEETISAVNWLCGGSIHLLDHYIGHWMGKGGPCNVAEATRVWANRLRLLFLLPLANDQFVELFNWMYRNEEFRLLENRIRGILGLEAATRFRNSAPWKRTVGEWIEHFELKPKGE